MEKLFKKDETLFAILWIVIYVIGFSNADMISETIGMPKAITACFGLVLSVLLFTFIRKNLLFEYFGLCGFKGSLQDFLYFIPLVLISSVNLWNGLTLHYDIPTSILNVVSMCFVGFLEEVIFRGFLFKSMCRSNLRFAIIVSSLTFGMGHIVNLLLGEPLFDTLLQLLLLYLDFPCRQEHSALHYFPCSGQFFKHLRCRALQRGTYFHYCIHHCPQRGVWYLVAVLWSQITENLHRMTNRTPQDFLTPGIPSWNSGCLVP